MTHAKVTRNLKWWKTPLIGLKAESPTRPPEYREVLLISLWIDPGLRVSEMAELVVSNFD